MKAAMLAVLVLAAVASADKNCIFKPKKMDCAWNLEWTEYSKDQNFWLRTTYYVDGLFWSAVTEDYGGNVLYRAANRPDIPFLKGNNTASLFTLNGGVCSQTLGHSFSSEIPFYDYLFREYEFPKCENDEFNGEDCKRYDVDLLVAKFSVYATEDHVIGVKAGKGALFDFDTTIELDWGSWVPMSRFAFSDLGTFRCPNDKIFKSGDDDYTKCAASGNKAVLVVVLAAVATALLSLF